MWRTTRPSLREADENTVTINAEKDQTANVTLSGANIDVSNEGKAAVSTIGEGNVSIELNGSNALRTRAVTPRAVMPALKRTTTVADHSGQG